MLSMQLFGDQLHIVPLYHPSDDGGGGGEGWGLFYCSAAETSSVAPVNGRFLDSEAYSAQLFIMQQYDPENATVISGI